MTTDEVLQIISEHIAIVEIGLNDPIDEVDRYGWRCRLYQLRILEEEIREKAR